MKFIHLCFLLLLAFGSAYNVQASCHVSDCPDEDFIALGNKFPSVGCFTSVSDGGIFGSGTVVDLGIPELKGRSILTCAHIFHDPETGVLKDSSKKDILFTLGSEGSFRGIFHTHPLYTRDNHSYDIALFILDAPIETICSSEIDLNTNPEDFLNQQFISVGFGVTGHVLGKYSIFDLNRRASYSQAHLQDNPQDDVHFIVCMKQYDQFEEKKITRHKGSVLSLCPYIFGKYVNENNTLETCNKPAGVSGPADSGGGCFSEDGKLVSIISNGSDFITALGDSPPRDRETVLEQVYFDKYQNELEKMFQMQQELYEKMLSEIKQTHPEMLPDFLLFNPLPPQMPKIIQLEEINNLLKPFYGLDLFNSHDPNKLNLSVSHETVLLSFHKEWLMSFEK